MRDLAMSLRKSWTFQGDMRVFENCDVSSLPVQSVTFLRETVVV